jgi:hypothetical protein
MPCPTPTYLGGDYDEDGARGPRMSKFIDALPDVVQLAVTKDVRRFMRATKRRYVLLIEDLGAGTKVFDLSAPRERTNSSGRRRTCLPRCTRPSGTTGPWPTTTPSVRS